MRTALVKASLLVSIAAVTACGPGSHRNGNGSGTVDAPPVSPSCANGGTGTAENTPATCSDGIDNDCDGLVDCSDPDCSGIGSCPVCGMVDNPLSTPLALPDGASAAGDPATCTTDADCMSGEHCFLNLDLANDGDNACRASYTDTLHFIGFPSNATFTAVSNIQSVCVTIEHSWMRDLEIQLVAPGGQVVQLQKFLGQTGSEIYLGQANDCDSDANPVPGTGAEYCWKPTATKPDMLDYANAGGTLSQVQGCDGASHDEMPPGDYSAADPWSNLIGTPLNGDWSFVVTDLWPIDNGYLFKWSISFDPSLVSDCSGPIIQ